MPRRSWKDLDTDAPSAPRVPGVAGQAGSGSADLEQAAALAPDSRLGALLEERRELEDRLRNLSGVPGQSSNDAHRDARFHVPSFAERQSEIRTWEAQRARRFEAASPEAANRFQSFASRTPSSFPGPRSALGGGPTTALGGSAISDRVRRLRSGVADRSSTARETVLARPRATAEKLQEAGRPLREIGDQISDHDRQMDDLDRKLAAEGLSEAERAEIRDATRIDGMDKAGALMDKANSAISAPKKAVQKIEAGWQRREQKITGPMDRFSDYARESERRLSTQTGGSGDLFERMLANRQSALRRRQAQKKQDQRDERQRERAREAAADRRAEDNRTAR